MTHYGSYREPYPSLEALLTGWLDVFEAGVSWLANPFLLAGWIFLLFRKTMVASILSAIAILFALSFLTFDKILADEGGNYSTISGLGDGYYLWLSSMIVMAIGSVIAYIQKKKSPPGEITLPNRSYPAQ